MRSYLDHNATTPLLPEARAAMDAALALTGNPSSVHAEGRAARATVEQARAHVAALAGVAPEAVVFTSGGTEANGLALRGAMEAAALAGAPFARVLYGATEHDSVRGLVEVLGIEALPIPVNRDGLIDLAALDRMLLAPGRSLVSVMAANNETGVLAPLAQIGELVRAAGGILHCDAVQAAGKIDLQPITAAAGLVSLSAHKFGGPKGAGALIVAPGHALAAQQRGGGQEHSLRAGTENLAAIAGFGAAAAWALVHRDEAVRLETLRDRIEREALKLVPQAVIHGARAARLPNTMLIGVEDVAAETQVIALDLEGIAVSAGSACSSGRLKASHVLTAMGFEPRVASSAIRVSLGWSTSTADVDRFLSVWPRIAARIRARRQTAAA